MQVEIKVEARYVLVRCKGELAAGNWFREVNERMESASVPHAVLDLNGVTYLNSSGVRRILELHSSLGGRKGGVILLSPQRQVAKILGELSLTKVIPTAECMEDVWAVLGKGEPEENTKPGANRGELQNLLDQASSAMLLIDSSGQVVFSNRAAQPLLGRVTRATTGLHGYKVTRLTVPLQGQRNTLMLMVLEPLAASAAA